MSLDNIFLRSASCWREAGYRVKQQHCDEFIFHLGKFTI